MELKRVLSSPKTGSERCESRGPIASSLYRRKDVRQAKVATLLLLAGIAGACAIGAPSTFMLNSASVDKSFVCPTAANNLPYNIHAAISVRNGTTRSATIESIAAVLMLAAVKGALLEHAGDKYKRSGVTRP